MWEEVTSSVSSTALLLCPMQSTFRWTVCVRERKNFNLTRKITLLITVSNPQDNKWSR